MAELAEGDLVKGSTKLRVWKKRRSRGPHYSIVRWNNRDSDDKVIRIFSGLSFADTRRMDRDDVHYAIRCWYRRDLEVQGYTYQDEQADGNCVFIALSRLIGETVEDIEKAVLKSTVYTSFSRALRKKLLPFRLGNSYVKHVANIRKKSWTSLPEVAAAAIAYNLEIHVLKLGEVLAERKNRFYPNKGKDHTVIKMACITEHHFVALVPAKVEFEDISVEGSVYEYSQLSHVTVKEHNTRKGKS